MQSLGRTSSCIESPPPSSSPPSALWIQRPSTLSASSAASTRVAASSAVRFVPSLNSDSDAALNRSRHLRSTFAHKATGEHSADSARGSAMVGKWGGLPRIAGTVPTMSLRMRGQDMPRYTRLPCVSRPRRPARPAICQNSSTRSQRWPCFEPVSSGLSSCEKATVRAGMFTPTASVSVAKTSLTSFCWKQSSTYSRRMGSMPLWWYATPFSSSPLMSR
mmetsp:Transcript_23320/g.76632  ORF Transcript_23320/g.76632 Transcript_23320/m.76632 type:complete len:219 (+) Transcript_23320:808-1464(+)